MSSFNTPLNAWIVSDVFLDGLNAEVATGVGKAELPNRKSALISVRSSAEDAALPVPASRSPAEQISKSAGSKNLSAVNRAGSVNGNPETLQLLVQWREL
jgi:hypothetical protein